MGPEVELTLQFPSLEFRAPVLCPVVGLPGVANPIQSHDVHINSVGAHCESEDSSVTQEIPRI